MTEAEKNASSEGPAAQRRRWSNRHRRVAWVTGSLLFLALAGGVIGWRIQQANEPEEYKPGEESSEITHSIQDRAQSKSPAGETPAAAQAPQRKFDALVELDKKRPAGAPAPRFTDVTREAGLGEFRSFAGKRTSQLPEDMGSGVAWGDFDNDGNEDVFLVSSGGPLDAPESELAPSQLYRNLGNGKFERVADFPQTRIHGMSAAWADYNNDGWLDLVVTGVDTILLFRNDHGKLVRDRRFPSPKGFWAGASWGDFNNDGKLDLYICGYVKYKVDQTKARGPSQQFGFDIPYTLNPASFEPERNLLFRNNGDGTFTEVAQQMGVANADGRSLSALWHDFDNDGWLDLYVANDISENKLYLNKHGKFVDAGKTAWIGEYRGSMGLASGDFDRDGDDDLFISHWIAQGYALYQSLFSEQKAAAATKPGEKPAATELHFADAAEAMGVGQPSLQSIGWGTSFVDFDSDGWPDLVVANGSTMEAKDGSKRLAPMPSFLFWNDHGRFFHDLAPWNKSLSTPHVSRGLAVADYDNDGSMDILVADLGEGVRLLRNDVPHGNWIEFRLHNRVGAEHKPIGFGDGATVIARSGKDVLRRTVGSSSYLSQDSRRVHIGLGRATKIDSLEVRWLGSKPQAWANLEANRIWDLFEGDTEARAFQALTSASGPDVHPPAAAKQPSKAELVQFWSVQHAAMDAMKRERDYARAAKLFREALALNPIHEDSRYYLANCLDAQGDIKGAIAELEELARINPSSHRAWQRRGVLLAAGATTAAQFAAAEESIRRAQKLNPEETGTLLLLGEIALLHGDLSAGERDFHAACQANPRSTGGLFFGAYAAWKRHDRAAATSLLAAAKQTLGPEWKPKGSVAEGDVKQRMDRDAGLLAPFWQAWSGTPDPDAAFAKLESYLQSRRRR